MEKSSFRLGEWTISRVEELSLELPADILIPDWRDVQLAAAEQAVVARSRAANGVDLTVPVHSWLLQRNDVTVLIDTGVGNGRKRRFEGFNGLDTDYLERLAAHGVTPGAVDFVLCTHIHTDHVGWNTTRRGGEWMPTFPNARYVWSKTDGAVARHPCFHDGPAAGVYEDSIAPILDAGLADEIDAGRFTPIPDFAFHSTPGHSPGHMSISLRTDAGDAFFGGDVLHNQVQVFRPDWNSVFCEDPEPARRSRRWALEYCADNDSIYFGTHTGGSSVGRIERTGAGFSWMHV